MIINLQKYIVLVLGLFLKLRSLIYLARVGNCALNQMAIPIPTHFNVRKVNYLFCTAVVEEVRGCVQLRGNIVWEPCI